MGWRIPKTEYINKLDKSPYNHRLVIVISHTSFWDFFILLLYKWADPRIGRYLKVIMKPQPFKWWGWFLRPIGCIPATRSEDSNGDFVNKTVEQFKNKNIRVIIAPEGMTNKHEWRSGYYHLTQGLKSSIMVGGLDYELKCLYIGEIYRWSVIKDWNRHQLEKVLQSDMTDIMPLNPKNSWVTSNRPYHKNRVGLIDPFYLIVWIISLIVIIWIIIIIYSSLQKHKNKKRK